MNIFLIFSSLFLVSVSGESPVSCASDNVACDAHEDNVLEEIGGVTNIEECRQLCYDNDECQFITYHGVDSFPFQEFCYLMKSCDETHSCHGCVSETRSCYQLCGSNNVGIIDNNHVDTYYDVVTEAECKEYCRQTLNCSFYTYFFEEDPNSQLCILLSHLIEPLKPCDTCVTGPLDCQESRECILEYNGESQKHLMFTEPGVHTNVNVSVSSPQSCRLTMFLVGGGGDYSSGSGSGAGSGYIQYAYATLKIGTTIISLTVGDKRQSSVVSLINGDNNVTVEALPGHDSSGGGGYSGGGAYGNTTVGCDGGTNGGDGESFGSRSGGHGTGEDISSNNFDNFDLTPGAGGKPYFVSSGNSYYGGGGGGVLVNGEGPQRDSDNQGEGYGGGGGTQDLHGLSGVILLEVSEV